MGKQWPLGGSARVWCLYLGRWWTCQSGSIRGVFEQRVQYRLGCGAYGPTHNRGWREHKHRNMFENSHLRKQS